MIDGRYELLNKLADGGFSEVFRARQLNTGKLVAIKLLLPERLEKNESHIEVARFEREMKLVAELKHPNIVPLLDSGRLENGQLFQVFEYISGLDLDKVLRLEGPLQPGEAKHLMLQVLDALSAAHDAGIVHRDLKPRNIMVSSSGLRRNAMVLDFGLGALVEEARDADYLELTARGRVPGTPAYVAPEQLLQEEITPQSDIYAWGLVFAECITGGPTVTGANLMQICRVHLAPEPIELPAWLAESEVGRVIARALDKSLEERYATALDVFSDLELCSTDDITVPTEATEPLAAMIDEALPSTEPAVVKALAGKRPPGSETIEDAGGTPPESLGEVEEEGPSPESSDEVEGAAWASDLSYQPDDDGGAPLKTPSWGDTLVLVLLVGAGVVALAWGLMASFGGEEESQEEAGASAEAAPSSPVITGAEADAAQAEAEPDTQAPDVAAVAAVTTAPPDVASSPPDAAPSEPDVMLEEEALAGRTMEALDLLCQEDQHAACVVFARRLLAEERSWASGQRAATRLDPACQAGWGEACLRYADLVEEGLGVLKDPERAAALREETCDAGHGRACYELGDALLELAASGGGDDEDVTRGVALIKRACDAGDLEGCERYGTALLLGKGVEAIDKEAAITFYERACRGEHAPACRRLGTFYKKGEVVPKDASRTVFYYEKACGLGEVWCCNELAHIHNAGMEPLGASPELARHFYGEACRMESGRGCYQLAQMLRAEEPVDDARIDVLMEQACRYGEQKACD